MMQTVNIQKQLAAISTHWQPRTVGRLNGQLVKLAKLKGEFIMHHHEQEDEMFMVLKGTLTIKFSSHTVSLSQGEFLVIPRGVEHQPVASEEVHVMLFEPETTVNTGNIINELTDTH